MQVRTVTINGKTLTDTEVVTLRMVFAMASMDLQSLDPKRLLEGCAVSEHLKNIYELVKHVGEE